MRGRAHPGLLHLAALPAVAMLAACGPVARPAVPPPTVPTAWSAPATTGEPPPGWLANFADPALVALADEALRGNHDLRAAAARVDAALAQVRIVAGDRAPALLARADGRRARQNFNFAGQQIAFTDSSWGISLDVSWEVDLWGRLRAGEAAVAAEAAVVAADAVGVRESLSGQLAKAWLGARAARDQSIRTAQARDNLASAVALADERYRAGLLAAESVRELRTALARTTDAEAVLRARLGTLTRQAEVLVGRHPAGALVIPAGLPALPPPLPAGVPASVLGRRPDLVAAERRLAAGGHRVAEARANLYPRLALTAAGGYASNQLGDLLRADSLVWSLGANLLQPLVQGGKLQANVARSDAETRALAHAFAAAVARALAEVEDALAAVAIAAERTAAQERIAAEAAALARLAEERHAAGLGDALAVLAARRGALDAEVALAAARLDQLIARVDLHLALGGEAVAPATASPPGTEP